MFIFIAEFLIFSSIIWITSYSFMESKNTTKTKDINYSELITELNWNDYKSFNINSRMDKDTSRVYKEIVLEFNDWELNENLCNFLNSKN